MPVMDPLNISTKDKEEGNNCPSSGQPLFHGINVPTTAEPSVAVIEGELADDNDNDLKYANDDPLMAMEDSDVSEGEDIGDVFLDLDQIEDTTMSSESSKRRKVEEGEEFSSRLTP